MGHGQGKRRPQKKQKSAKEKRTKKENSASTDNMAKIEKDIEQRIKERANVADVLRDRGVNLFRKGTNLLGLCPFHEDRHIGSFVVNERRGFYHCFSCGAHGDAVTALMELDGLSYPDALRYLAAMYGIVIDDGPVPQVPKRVPRPIPEPTKPIIWPGNVIIPHAKHVGENNLVKWMHGLPMKASHREMLDMMLGLYQVGTSMTGSTQGWTVFPLLDAQLYLRDAKLMKYQPDGHRDKESRVSVNWMSALLKKAGRYDDTKYHVERCLFGLHLMKVFEKAEVCIVESEKTAVLCSAFSDPNERIWMATGGKSGLRPALLHPLMDAGKTIVLYPDYDAYDEWAERCKAFDYANISVSQMVRREHIAADGPKADAADIMVRKMEGVQETEYDKACRMLGVESNQALRNMMEKLDLKLERI